MNKKKESSKTLLQEILDKSSCPDNLKFSFFQHNKLERKWDIFRQSGLCEIFGVFHTKIYIFDDTVILTGANLSQQYFENRKDRYVILNKAKKFANFLDDYLGIFADLGDIAVKNGEELQ